MHERLEALETAIFALDDAMGAIAELGDDAMADVECLAEMKRGYQKERDRIHGQIEADDAAEQAALEREYWREAM